MRRPAAAGGQPHGGEHLKDLLVGQILWVTPSQLGAAAVLTAPRPRRLVPGLGKRLGRAGFYGLFALAVTASVQLVGVYLVFTSLSRPSPCVRCARRGGCRWPHAIGAAGYLLGLALSARLDLSPSGAVVVLAMAVIARSPRSSRRAPGSRPAREAGRRQQSDALLRCLPPASGTPSPATWLHRPDRARRTTGAASRKRVPAHHRSRRPADRRRAVELPARPGRRRPDRSPVAEQTRHEGDALVLGRAVPSVLNPVSTRHPPSPARGRADRISPRTTDTYVE